MKRRQCSPGPQFSALSVFPSLSLQLQWLSQIRNLINVCGGFRKVDTYLLIQFPSPGGICPYLLNLEKPCDFIFNNFYQFMFAVAISFIVESWYMFVTHSDSFFHPVPLLLLPLHSNLVPFPFING